MGAGDKGVGAEIDVEQGALCALEEHLLVFPDGVVGEHRHVRDILPQTVAVSGILLDDRVEVERSAR